MKTFMSFPFTLPSVVIFLGLSMPAHSADLDGLFAQFAESWSQDVTIQLQNGRSMHQTLTFLAAEPQGTPTDACWFEFENIVVFKTASGEVESTTYYAGTVDATRSLHKNENPSEGVMAFSDELSYDFSTSDGFLVRECRAELPNGEASNALCSSFVLTAPPSGSRDLAASHLVDYLADCRSVGEAAIPEKAKEDLAALAALVRRAKLAALDHKIYQTEDPGKAGMNADVVVYAALDAKKKAALLNLHGGQTARQAKFDADVALAALDAVYPKSANGTGEASLADSADGAGKDTQPGDTCTTVKGEAGFVLTGNCLAADVSNIVLEGATKADIIALSKFKGNNGKGISSLELSKAQFTDFSILATESVRSSLSNLNSLTIENSTISYPVVLPRIEGLFSINLQNSIVPDVSFLTDISGNLGFVVLPTWRSVNLPEDGPLEDLVREVEDCVFLSHGAGIDCLSIKERYVYLTGDIRDLSFLTRFERIEYLGFREANIDLDDKNVIEPILRHSGIELIETREFGVMSIADFKEKFQ